MIQTVEHSEREWLAWKYLGWFSHVISTKIILTQIWSGKERERMNEQKPYRLEKEWWLDSSLISTRKQTARSGTCCMGKRFSSKDLCIHDSPGKSEPPCPRPSVHPVRSGHSHRQHLTEPNVVISHKSPETAGNWPGCDTVTSARPPQCPLSCALTVTVLSTLEDR